MSSAFAFSVIVMLLLILTLTNQEREERQERQEVTSHMIYSWHHTYVFIFYAFLI